MLPIVRYGLRSNFFICQYILYGLSHILDTYYSTYRAYICHNKLGVCFELVILL